MYPRHKKELIGLNLHWKQPSVKDASGVRKESWHRGLARTIAHVGGDSTSPKEHLVGLLQDVLGTEPRHGDHPLPAPCGAGQRVLAGGDRRGRGGSGRC